MNVKENNIENMDKNDDDDYHNGKCFLLRILMKEDNKGKCVHMWTYLLIHSSLNI